MPHKPVFANLWGMDVQIILYVIFMPNISALVSDVNAKYFNIGFYAKCFSITASFLCQIFQHCFLVNGKWI